MHDHVHARGARPLPSLCVMVLSSSSFFRAMLALMHEPSTDTVPEKPLPGGNAPRPPPPPTTNRQVGDILDRGDGEIRILMFLERLQAEADAAGGKLYLLNGNHETMNVMGDHRYATAGRSGLGAGRGICPPPPCGEGEGAPRALACSPDGLVRGHATKHALFCTGSPLQRRARTHAQRSPSVRRTRLGLVGVPGGKAAWP